MQEHLFEHFKSDGLSGFLENVSIKLIDKTDGKDPERRENKLYEDTQNLCSIWT